MTRSSFRRDLALSEKAVHLVMDHLIDRDIICYELVGKREQKFGDIRVMCDSNEERNIEVKFDIMAERTGNLCFEVSNGERPTGIFETVADEVFYVVPDGKDRKIFKFKTADLRAYILDPLNVIRKKGGDNKKFDLVLVNISKIVEDNIPFELVVIDA